MKLGIIAEGEVSDALLHIFHGTFLDNIAGIQKRGFTRGDADRVHFALTASAADTPSEPYALIEVVLSQNHPKLADPFIGYSNGREHPDQQVAQFDKDYDRESLLSSPKLADERRRYWDAMSRYTQSQGLAPDTKEVNLPLQFGFSGDPKIVAIYVISNSIVSAIKYRSSEASLAVGDEI